MSRQAGYIMGVPIIPITGGRILRSRIGPDAEIYPDHQGIMVNRGNRPFSV